MEIDASPIRPQGSNRQRFNQEEFWDTLIDNLSNLPIIIKKESREYNTDVIPEPKDQRFYKRYKYQLGIKQR